MHRKTQFFFFALWMIVSSSCLPYFNQTPEVIRDAERLIDQFPDSAFRLLETIEDPVGLREEDRNRYYLLYIEARDKTYRDIVSEIRIFRVKEYYVKKNEQQPAARAGFYCGRVLQEQKKPEEAMLAYLAAGEEASQVNDFSLLSRIEFYIADLNYDRLCFSEAIPHYRMSVDYIKKADGSYKELIAGYHSLANCLLVGGQTDSAFFYYEKALECAVLNEDEREVFDVKQGMGVAYLEQKEYSQAKSLFDELLLSETDGDERAKLYFCLAQVYWAESKKESALSYLRQTLDSIDENRELESSVYLLLSEVEEESGNYKESLVYYQQHSDLFLSLWTEKEKERLLDIQRRYDFESLQSANRELKIEKLRVAIFLALVIIVVTFFSSWRHFRDEKALLTARQQVRHLKTMAFSAREEDRSVNARLRRTLFDQLTLFKNISLLETYLSDEEKERGRFILKKVNSIIRSSDATYDWNLFYQSVNVLHDNFLLRLREKFPLLNDNEVLICCLTRINLSNSEIALLTHSTTDVIQKRKSLIREKTSMKRRESFSKQLESILDEA